MSNPVKYHVTDLVLLFHLDDTMLFVSPDDER